MTPKTSKSADAEGEGEGDGIDGEGVSTAATASDNVPEKLPSRSRRRAFARSNATRSMDLNDNDFTFDSSRDVASSIACRSISESAAYAPGRALARSNDSRMRALSNFTFDSARDVAADADADSIATAHASNTSKPVNRRASMKRSSINSSSNIDSSRDVHNLSLRTSCLLIHSLSNTDSARRAGLPQSLLTQGTLDQMNGLGIETNVKDWLRSFRDLDPRIQLLEFFNGLSLEGVENFESQGSKIKGSFHTPKILRGFTKCGQFSVWRPTSNDAIRKMMTGEGTGKGLDIKGKSATCGEYSGYVPYLQIHENEHKKDIKSLNVHKRVRVFYPNEYSRDIAMGVLATQSQSMTDRATKAKQIVKEEDTKRERILDNFMQTSMRKIRRPSLISTQNIDEALTTTHRYDMADPSVHEIDDYARDGVYGLDIPERLFWETYVVPHDITRPKGSKHDTGRPSMPEFQQMNMETLRNWSDKTSYSNTNTADGSSDPKEENPRPVLWHGGCGRVGEEAPADSDPMCPLGLLMAYEENGKVTPVVSDFDCFLVGTRGVKYHEPLGAQELSILSWCLKEIEGILEVPKEGLGWTNRWLEVKKKHVENETLNCKMPKFGYADPRSYSMMKGAVHHLKSNGAVRHGPECFNYGFPQELDDSFLVISDSFPGVPWRYTNGRELIDILSEKVDEGFTFPLNPKWILCDPGWKKIYDKMLLSQKPIVQDSLKIWYPDRIRRRINEISTRFPQGFIYSGKADLSVGVRFDLAQLELQRYKVRLSSRRKLREALSRRSMGTETLIYCKDLGSASSILSCESDADISLKTKTRAHKSAFLATVRVVQMEKDSKKKKRRSSSIFVDFVRSSLSSSMMNEEMDDDEVSQSQSRRISSVSSKVRSLRESATHSISSIARQIQAEFEDDEDNSEVDNNSETHLPQSSRKNSVSSKDRSMSGSVRNSMSSLVEDQLDVDEDNSNVDNNAENPQPQSNTRSRMISKVNSLKESIKKKGVMRKTQSSQL